LKKKASSSTTSQRPKIQPLPIRTACEGVDARGHADGREGRERFGAPAGRPAIERRDREDRRREHELRVEVREALSEASHVRFFFSFAG